MIFLLLSAEQMEAPTYISAIEGEVIPPSEKASLVGTFWSVGESGRGGREEAGGGGGGVENEGGTTACDEWKRANESMPEVEVGRGISEQVRRGKMDDGGEEERRRGREGCSQR